MIAKAPDDFSDLIYTASKTEFKVTVTALVQSITASDLAIRKG